MVRPVRKTSTSHKFKNIITSPFLMPFAVFLFVVITLPVVYLMSQETLDIRQRAATISNGPIAINTDEASYAAAAQEVAPVKAFNWTLGVVIVFVVAAGTASFMVYRKRANSF